MINKHLTDPEIQQYALSKADCDQQHLQHITGCEDCRQKAEQYSLLFNAIGHEEIPLFDFNLSALVLKQLPQAEKANVLEKYFVHFITSVLIALPVVLLYLCRIYILNLFSGNAMILTALIITAIGSLSIFLCLDMYRKYKKQMEALNFY